MPEPLRLHHGAVQTYLALGGRLERMDVVRGRAGTLWLVVADPLVYDKLPNTVLCRALESKDGEAVPSVSRICVKYISALYRGCYPQFKHPTNRATYNKE